MQENSWNKLEIKSNITPEPRSGHSSCIHKGNFLYIFGGYTEKDAMNDMYSLSLETLKWDKLSYSNLSNNNESEIPSRRASSVLVSCSILDSLFLFGGTGLNPQNLAKNYLYEFDVSKLKWRIVKSIGQPPSERYGHTINIYKNYLVLFGGVKFIKNKTPEFLNDLYFYAIIDKKWTNIKIKGNIPNPRHGHQCVISQNKYYIIGGTNSLVRFGNIHMIDLFTFESNLINFEYSKKKDYIFKGRYGHAAIMDENEESILIFGGRDDEICEDILCLNTKSKIWKRKKCKGKKPTSREFCSYAYFNQNFFVFGGRRGENRMNDIYIWNISIPKGNFSDCSLREDMLNLYNRLNNENLSDILLTSNTNKKYYLHRNILRYRSEYFYEKLTNKNGLFEIFVDADDTLIEILIEYIYSANIIKPVVKGTIDIIRFLSKTDLHFLFKNFLLVLLNDRESEQEIINLISELSKIKSSLDPNKSYLKKNVQIIEAITNFLSYKVKVIKKQLNPEEIKENSNKYFILDEKIFENLNESHINSFYQDFEMLYNDKEFTDIDINVKNKNFKGHKNILMARSKYFESIVLFNFEENNNNQINVDDQILDDPEIFENLLRFFYYGFSHIKRMQFKLEMAKKFLEVSFFFQIKCKAFNFLIEDKISEFLSQDNCFEILDIADRISAKTLKEKTLSFIVESFSSVVLKNEKILEYLPSYLLVEVMTYFSNRHN